jgi:hypothetical protein
MWYEKQKVTGGTKKKADFRVRLQLQLHSQFPVLGSRRCD